MTVTITNPAGQTVTSSVNVTVNQTLASITVSPSPVSLGGQSTQQFTATGFDQFGTALATQPSFTWSTASGATNVGTISATGLLTAANLSVTGPVTATSGGISGSGTVTVTGTSPTIAIGAPSTSYAAGGPVTYAVTYTDPNFNSSNLVAGDITLNKTGNRQRHAQRHGLGPELHGDPQQRHGQRQLGDFHRGRHRLGQRRQPGPGRRTERDLHGRQHRPHDLDRRALGVPIRPAGRSPTR